MRETDRFEIERAYDLLPHVIGASWASIFFRLNQIKNPTREEYRGKAAEYLRILERIPDLFPEEQQFFSIKEYVVTRYAEEIQKVLEGRNPEIEKRYKRYIDYG